MNFLFILADKHPLFRVDLTVLFAKYIKRKGYTMAWIMPSKLPAFFDKTEWTGGTAYLAAHIKEKTFFRKFLNFFFVSINCLRAIPLFLKNTYDFVQIKDQYLPAVVFLILRKFKKTPVFFWISYPFPEAFLESYKMKLCKVPVINLVRGKLLEFLTYKYICPSADHIFVQSLQMQKDMVGKGVSPTKMTVVPMGIDPEMVSTLQAIPPLPHGDQSLLFTGMFYKIRRIEFLFDVFELVRESVPHATLYMIGEAESSEYKQELLAQVQSKGLQNSIIFTGFLSHEVMYRHIKSASVCLSVYYPTPVLDSTSPTKLIEYMAMGKPSVVTEHPEQRLLIEESRGGICIPYDARQMADAVVYLLQNKDVAQRMGENAQIYIAQTRSYDIISDMLDKKYKSLVSNI